MDKIVSKIGDLEIHPPHGGTSCGFTSIQRCHSSVEVNGVYGGVNVSIDRDDEPVIKKVTLTLEEGWMLYTLLRSLFYETRKAERELYKNKYSYD